MSPPISYDAREREVCFEGGEEPPPALAEAIALTAEAYAPGWAESSKSEAEFPPRWPTMGETDE